MKINLIAQNKLHGLGVNPKPANAVTQLDNTISTIIGVLTLIAFIYFVIQVILAGYSFISGQGDEKKIESARKRLTNGILGITIVVVAFGITALLATLLGLGNIFNLNTNPLFNNEPYNVDELQEVIHFIQYAIS